MKTKSLQRIPSGFCHYTIEYTDKAAPQFKEKYNMSLFFMSNEERRPTSAKFHKGVLQVGTAMAADETLYHVSNGCRWSLAGDHLNILAAITGKTVMESVLVELRAGFRQDDLHEANESSAIVWHFDQETLQLDFNAACLNTQANIRRAARENMILATEGLPDEKLRSILLQDGERLHPLPLNLFDNQEAFQVKMNVADRKVTLMNRKSIIRIYPD